MSTLDAKQLENAHAFMAHLTAPNWDAMEALLSPEFKHQYFPPSFQHGGENKNVRGKEEYVELMKSSIFKTFERLTFTAPLDVVHGSNKVAVHIRSDGTTKSGKQYNNEYMFTFHFEGEKITRINEFVDSKYTAEFFTALAAE
ncbi:hypothetical protein C8R43DRAFT_1048819 [Mycena crocata]|nr:hypothetical protein C8R43DRAFT_1048819 [Mycena crocata]